MKPILVRKIEEPLASTSYITYSSEWYKDRTWFEFSIPFRVYSYAYTKFTDQGIFGKLIL